MKLTYVLLPFFYLRQTIFNHHNYAENLIHLLMLMFQMIDPEQPPVERQVSRVSLVHRESTVLSFDDIHYNVQVKQNPCSKAYPKTIIDGVR